MRRPTKVALSVLLLLISASNEAANPVRIAVASNFNNTIRSVVAAFQKNTGYELTTVLGSTGKLYAQIVNGAPMDIFLAADSAHPERLEKQGRGIPGSRFTYAVGQLVLWSPIPGYVDSEGARLTTKDFRYLAIANPRLAPYGRAAQQVLEARGLWNQVAMRIVTGENISQTYQFIASGNAQMGFVALSQIKDPAASRIAGSHWLVPASLHDAIEQQALLLNSSPAAVAFLEFLHSEEARDIIVSHGYKVP